MRILLIGAYGFIGSEIAGLLLRHGHEVRGFGRDVGYGRRILPQLEWHRGDLRDHVDKESWLPIVQNVDAVVNASGLRTSPNSAAAVSKLRSRVAAAIETGSRPSACRSPWEQLPKTMANLTLVMERCPGAIFTAANGVSPAIQAEPVRKRFGASPIGGGVASAGVPDRIGVYRRWLELSHRAALAGGAVGVRS
jgi:hypothetical protein